MAGAVRRLDPGSRALLDLSLRRRVPDERIGRVLGTGADEVRRRRALLIKRIAAELELTGIDDRARLRHELEHLPAETWNGGEAAPASRRPRRRLRALAAGACVLALAIAAFLVSSSGREGPAVTVTASALAGPLPGPEVNLDWLAGPQEAVAKARLVGERGEPRIELVLAGLAPAKRAVYVAWLYNSRADAVPLARWRAGEGGLELNLPADWTRYRWLDVTLESQSGGRMHAGNSLLRTELARLSNR